MNPEWQQQLLALNASLAVDGRVVFKSADTREAGDFIYPVSHLAVLRVSGNDAKPFLQGQSTCNINDLNPEKASFGAFCNAKGRVISSFIIIPSQANWLLILPGALLPQIQQRLQMYILRSDVQLTDYCHDYCLTGVQLNAANSLPFKLPGAHLAVLQEPLLSLRLDESNARYLFIADSRNTLKLWSDLLERNFIPHSSSNWELLDICAGIPWLTTETSEEYIPQMLNLDQLGAISFNKGCYTGQEIVARTHYLGKAKRAMFIAQAEISDAPKFNTPIIDAANQQIVGSVLTFHCHADIATLLVILNTDASHLKSLCIQNQLNTQITVL